MVHSIARKFLFLVSLCSYLACFGAPALADQCSYISKQQAIAAISRLSLNNTIYHLCESCGEKFAKKALIHSLGANTVDYEDYWQIQVNGKGIDLAYVFVDSKLDGQLINLAIVADCKVEGVSATIRLLKSNSENNKVKWRWIDRHPWYKSEKIK